MNTSIPYILLATLCLGACNNESSTTPKVENETPVSQMVFTDSLGNQITKEELSKVSGPFNYSLVGIENVSQHAKNLHNEARTYGQEGNYAKAIELLTKAHQEAPKWPYPVYDLAYTYLLQDDFKNALTYYQLTDDLSPRGFFTSKTALYTLKKEAKGEFKQGLYKMYISLEWIQSPQEKMEMIQLMLSDFPTYPPIWKEYAYMLDGENRLKAIKTGLKLNPDTETKGLLLLNKALLLKQSGERQKAMDILTQIIFDAQSTPMNVELAKYTLNDVSEMH